MKITCMAAVALVSLGTPLWAGAVAGQADCQKSCETVLVYLEGTGPAGEDPGTAVFDQKDKVFIPHLLPVRQGTTVEIKNGDPFLHNVHVYQGKETVLNLALPFQGQVIPHEFSEPGVYNVGCDAHPEMSAFIVVLESPYFTVPGEDGSYEIADVPAGSYTLVVHDVAAGREVRSSIEVN